MPTTPNSLATGKATAPFSRCEKSVAGLRERFVIGWLFIIVNVTSAQAIGHQPGVSYSEFNIETQLVRVELKASALELNTVVAIDENGDGKIDGAEVTHSNSQIVDSTLRRVRVLQNGEACPFVPGAVSLDSADGVIVSGAWKCPTTVTRLNVEMEFLSSFPRGHTHLTKVSTSEGTYEHALRVGSDSFEIEAGSKGHGFGEFLLLGIHHIFTGYDHIAFLLGLLLLGGSLRGLIKVVTSFTIAHSITLAVAALGLFAPPTRVVESAIAGSIVYIAFENSWAVTRGKDSFLARRWIISFCFGLIHGFGFAGLLRQLALPRAQLAAGLLGFNLGVEVGQVCIVAIALPLVQWLHRRRGFVPTGIWAISGAIGGMGLIWFIQRLFY